MTDYAALEPHGPIEPLFDNVWTVTGSVVMAPLIRLPRNMTILRHDGELTLVNAVRLSDEGMAQLAVLGKIKNVVRIGMHGMDDAWYVEEHGATLWAPEGMKHKHGLPTTEVLGPDNVPMPGLTYFGFELTTNPEGALLYHAEGGLLITCDSVQNWVDTQGCSVMAKAVTHLMGFVKPAQIGPPWRKIQTPKGGSLKPDFDRLVTLDFQHLVGGHGVPLRDTAKARLRETIAREL
jgi:hypothetical protein